MNRQVQLVSAVGSEFVLRKVRPLLVVATVLLASVLAVLIWLISTNAWWWLLAIPLLIIIFALLILFMLARRIVNRIRPAMTKEQKSGVNDFVDKFERVTDTVHTPMFLIVFRIVRDVIFPRSSSYVRTVAKEGTSLHKDFLELARLF